MYTFAVLTCSDTAFTGDRSDKSGKLLVSAFENIGFKLNHYLTVPDELEVIQETLNKWTFENIDLILTTGGTGLSDRDVTPEATIAVADRHVPGIQEAIRTFGQTKTPFAVLSRGVCVIKNKTLIVNLPGSENGTRDGITVLEPIITHALGQLSNLDRGH